MGASLAATAGPSARLTGILFVAGAGLLWSTGGTLARFIGAEDAWTIVFWRGTFAAFVSRRLHAPARKACGHNSRLPCHGLAGLIVGFCFAVASTSFVIALQYTTVANIVLMQAATPLIAALIGRFSGRACFGGTGSPSLLSPSGSASWCPALSTGVCR